MSVSEHTALSFLNEKQPILKPSQFLPRKSISRGQAIVRVHWTSPRIDEYVAFLTIEHYRLDGITDLHGCKILSVSERVGVVSTRREQKPWGTKVQLKPDEIIKEGTCNEVNNNQVFLMKNRESIELIVGLTRGPGPCQTPRSMYNSYLEIVKSEMDTEELPKDEITELSSQAGCSIL